MKIHKMVKYFMVASMQDDMYKMNDRPYVGPSKEKFETMGKVLGNLKTR